MSSAHRTAYIDAVLNRGIESATRVWLGATINYADDTLGENATGNYLASSPAEVVAALELTLDEEIVICAAACSTGVWETTTLTVTIAGRMATILIYALPGSPAQNERNTLFIGPNALKTKAYWSIEDLILHAFELP